MEAYQPPLSANQIERYSRQLILKGWSGALQLSLAQLHVAVSAELPAAALYLAAAGVGKISLTGEAGPVATVSKLIRRLNPESQVLAFNCLDQAPAAQIRDAKDPQIDLSEGTAAQIVISQSANGQVVEITTQRLTSNRPGPINFNNPVTIPLAGSSRLPNGLLTGSAAAVCLLQWWRLVFETSCTPPNG